MSLQKILTVGVLALVGGPVVACVSTETVEEAPVDPYASQAAFCTELAKAQCNATIVQACYQSTDAADTESCQTAAEFATNCIPSVVPTDAPSKMTYVKTDAAACVTRAGEVYADARVTLDELESLHATCINVFHANGSTGQPCTYDSDCSTPNGLRCIHKPGVASVCAVPVEAGGGQSCTGSDKVCADGFYCNVDAGACLEAPGANDDCGADTPCGEGLICTGGAVDGFCIAKADVGDSCLAAEECASGFCVTATGAPMGTCRADKLYDVAFETCDEFR